MEIKKNISLREYTTFKLGGNARFFVRVKSVEELRDALKFAGQKNLRTFVLGGGSNILVSEKGFDGLVIKIELVGIEWKDNGEVIVGAGESWDDFVSLSVDKGLWGIENLSGIPGTVGAAPVQNIGAYGVEVKDVIIWVETLDRNSGEINIFKNQECKFNYRDSFFKTKEGKNFIITRVAFNLLKNGEPNLTYKDLVKYFEQNHSPAIKEIRNAILKIRSGKFPDLKKFGTAGSFFKNPIITKEKYVKLLEKFPDLPCYPLNNTNVKIPLAWVLDNICKLKGERKGDVGLYKKQPLVLVNFGGATAEGVNKVVDEIVEKVKKMTGIEIEREVQIIN